jgi:hypothetical protein
VPPARDSDITDGIPMRSTASVTAIESTGTSRVALTIVPAPVQRRCKPSGSPTSQSTTRSDSHQDSRESYSVSKWLNASQKTLRTQGAADARRTGDAWARRALRMVPSLDRARAEPAIQREPIAGNGQVRVVQTRSTMTRGRSSTMVRNENPSSPECACHLLSPRRALAPSPPRCERAAT